jgi:hypothetical protein
VVSGLRFIETLIVELFCVCVLLYMQWRLRPPAADLLRDHTAAWHELTLMYVLLGAPLLHK